MQSDAVGGVDGDLLKLAMHRKRILPGAAQQKRDFAWAWPGLT